MGPRVTAVPNDSERRCQERRRKHRRLEQAPLTVPNNETESDSDSDDDDDDEDEDFEPTNYQPPTINRSAPSAAAIRLLSAGASRATALPAAVVQTAPCSSSFESLGESFDRSFGKSNCMPLPQRGLACASNAPDRAFSCARAEKADGKCSNE